MLVLIGMRLRLRLLLLLLLLLVLLQAFVDVVPCVQAGTYLLANQELWPAGHYAALAQGATEAGNCDFVHGCRPVCDVSHVVAKGAERFVYERTWHIRSGKYC
jgi:hypothetical protein